MHVRRALALAVAGPLLLAGCTGDPEPTPKIPDPTTSSSTPSPSDSETPEVESAEDFIRRWSEELQRMQATGSTTRFRKLGPDCESCIKTAERVEEIYGAGGSIEWDGWTIVSIESVGSAGTEFRVVERSAPTRFRESADSDWQTLGGGRTTHVFELLSVDDSWLVARAAEAAS
jgi:hypothetical protein